MRSQSARSSASGDSQVSTQQEAGSEGTGAGSSNAKKKKKKKKKKKVEDADTPATAAAAASSEYSSTAEQHAPAAPASGPDLSGMSVGDLKRALEAGTHAVASK